MVPTPASILPETSFAQSTEFGQLPVGSWTFFFGDVADLLVTQERKAHSNKVRSHSIYHCLRLAHADGAVIAREAECNILVL